MSNKRMMPHPKSTLAVILQSVLLVATCFTILSAVHVEEAQAWRQDHTRTRFFKPRFAMSVSAGFTMYTDYYEDDWGVYEDAAFSHGIVGMAGHLWIHPNISLDLGLDYHFLTDYDTNTGVGFASIKPGVRIRFGHYYLRGALDMAFSQESDDPMLFGFVIGAGWRVPIGHRMRFFAEVDLHVLFNDRYSVLPINAKAGLELMF